MKRIKLLKNNMNPKVKARLRCCITFCCIITIVVLFVAMIIGISLGRGGSDDGGCGGGKSTCNNRCVNYGTDPNNCGGCGKRCPAGASCYKGGCEFCPPNLDCANDNNVCTIAPCNATTGCAQFDCDNDADLCSTFPCDPINGCTPVNCTSVCTTGTCDPATGQCQPIDCTSLGDPCLVGPCNPKTGGCNYACPILYLSTPPSTNFTFTYPNVFTPRRITGTQLQVDSSYNVNRVTITLSPTGAGGSFNYTAQPGITDTGLQGDVFTLTGSADPSYYQAVLRTLLYSNQAFPGNVATFTFDIENERKNATALPISTINIAP